MGAAHKDAMTAPHHWARTGKALPEMPQNGHAGQEVFLFLHLFEHGIHNIHRQRENDGGILLPGNID